MGIASSSISAVQKKTNSILTFHKIGPRFVLYRRLDRDGSLVVTHHQGAAHDEERRQQPSIDNAENYIACDLLVAINNGIEIATEFAGLVDVPRQSAVESISAVGQRKAEAEKESAAVDKIENAIAKDKRQTDARNLIWAHARQCEEREQGATGALHSCL